LQTKPSRQHENFTALSRLHNRRQPSSLGKIAAQARSMEAIYELLQNARDLPPTPQVLIKVLGALRHEQVTI